MAKENWLARLRQAWCGLTTGHDFEYHDVSNEDYVQRILECQDCGAIFRSRKYDVATESFRRSSDELTNQMARFNLGRVKVEPGLVPLNAGQTHSLFKSALPFDRKAFASSRPRGPNGKFLPKLSVAKCKAISKKLQPKRNKNGQFARKKK